MSPTRENVVSAARRWVGTRYQHQGRLLGVGVDCIGLVGGVAQACGIAEGTAWAADREFFGYGRRPDPALLTRACLRYLDPVPSLAAALPADILVMRFEAEPAHFALLSAADYIIHAYLQARKVVETRLDAEWTGRILSVYRFRGLA